MPSHKQLAANRRNALKSTGPKSNCGKARSSRNSFKHGISSTCARLKKELEPNVGTDDTGVYGSHVADTISSLLLADRRLAEARLILWNDCAAKSLPDPSFAKRLLRLERYGRAIFSLKALAARQYLRASRSIAFDAQQVLVYRNE